MHCQLSSLYTADSTSSQILCLVGRAANIFPLSFIMNYFREHKIDKRMQLIMWFSGEKSMRVAMRGFSFYPFPLFFFPHFSSSSIFSSQLFSFHLSTSFLLTTSSHPYSFILSSLFLTSLSYFSPHIYSYLLLLTFPLFPSLPTHRPPWCHRLRPMPSYGT